MNGYEKILKVIREQNRLAPTACIGTMTSESVCQLGTLVLDEDDLLIASHLKGKLEKGDEVYLQKLSEETYVILAKVVSM